MCRNSRLEWLVLLNILAATLATWTLVTEDTGPSPRSVHAAAWDSSSQRFWIHGGSGEAFLNDLWTFDLRSNSWNLLPDNGRTPSGREDHVAVWDPGGQALWVHGGFDGTNFLRDVWKYSGNSWSLVADSSSYGPGARADHVAVWDASSFALWIHGGYDGVLHDDLWKFDSQAGSWISISISKVPSARAYHVAAWDEANSDIWIHGGFDGGLCRDIWKFDTTAFSWSQVSADDGPSARAYHVGAWDPSGLALWIHGGFDGIARRDVWRLNTLTSRWELLHDSSGPIRRYNHVAGFDARSQSFWIHGGYEGSTLQDLWRFDITTTTTSSSSTWTTVTLSTSSTTFTTSRSSTSRTTSSTSSSTRTSSSSSTTTLTTTSFSSTTTTSSTKTATTSSSSTHSSSLTSSTTSSTHTSSTSTVSSSSTTTTSRSSTVSSSTNTTRTTSTSTTNTTMSTSLSSTFTTSSLTFSSSTSSTLTRTSRTNTSTTVTISSSTSSTVTVSTSTSSSITRSSVTSSSATQTRTSTSSSTRTLTTSTSSTATTTTTTPEDLTAMLVLCPTLGVVTLGVLAAMACWAYKHCRCERVLIVPAGAPPAPPPQWWPPPPHAHHHAHPQSGWLRPPNPAPTASPAPPTLTSRQNTQLLSAPPDPQPVKAPPNPHLQPLLPDLHVFEPLTNPPLEVIIKIEANTFQEAPPQDVAASDTKTCSVTFQLAPTALVEGRVVLPRVPGDTMTAPVLRLAPPGASITRPFLTLPAQQPHPAAGPQQDIARRKGVASSRFAFELPDLCKCRGRMMDEAYCSPASPTPQVVHVPHILLGPAPSISARLTYEVLAATDALHPRWLGETMVAPVLEVPRSGSHTAGVATVVPPIPDVLPPEFLYRKEEVAISPTPSTACCLNHLCARKPRCVEQADQNVSDLIEVLRYLE